MGIIVCVALEPACGAPLRKTTPGAVVATVWDALVTGTGTVDCTASARVIGFGDDPSWLASTRMLAMRKLCMPVPEGRSRTRGQRSDVYPLIRPEKALAPSWGEVESFISRSASVASLSGLSLRLVTLSFSVTERSAINPPAGAEP